MKHAIHQVRSFEIVSPYTLCVRFDDRTEQTIDFEPILAGELYGPPRDLKVFHQVRIDSDAHTLVWPNGADFDPATLHDLVRVRARVLGTGAALGNGAGLTAPSRARKASGLCGAPLARSARRSIGRIAQRLGNFAPK